MFCKEKQLFHENKIQIHAEHFKNMFCVVEPACDELDKAVTFFG